MDKRTLNRRINKILFGDRRCKPENRGGILTPLLMQDDFDGDEYELTLSKKKKKRSCLGCGCLIVILLVVIFGAFCVIVSNYTADNVNTDSSAKEGRIEKTDSASEGSPAKLEPEDRTWTNRKDGRTITGKYLDYKDGKASVLRDNGKTVTIPLELLSDEDREYIKSIRKQEK